MTVPLSLRHQCIEYQSLLLLCGNFSVGCNIVIWNTVIWVKFHYLSFDIRLIASLLLLRELFHRTYLGRLRNRDVCVMHFTISHVTAKLSKTICS